MQVVNIQKAIQREGLTYLPGVAIVSDELAVSLIEQGAELVGPYSPPPEPHTDPVKVYRVLLTQTDQNSPVDSVLRSDLVETPVWSYSGTGRYIATSVGGFPVGRLFITCDKVRPGNKSGVVANYSVTRLSDDELELVTQGPEGNTDGQLTEYPLEVLVYPVQN
jgi:hypothetical protein